MSSSLSPESVATVDGVARRPAMIDALDAGAPTTMPIRRVGAPGVARALFANELRELVAGRALWAMLAIVSLLVGYSFIQAVNLFAEASRSAEKFPEIARGLSPLDGILVPTFGALYLANTFLLPFVAIRAIGHEKQSGSLKLLLQLPLSAPAIVAVKALAIGCGWLLALIPGLSAVAFWLAFGGHIAPPELAVVLLGHALYALVIVGIAFVTATLTESVATAAILTLAITLGCWVLDFAATTQTGWVRDLASFSLTTSLRTFEHGLLASSTGLLMVLLGGALLAVSAAWLPTGERHRHKLVRAAAIVAVTVGLIGLTHWVSTYADLTEDRRNSFNPADERALHDLTGELHLTIYMIPQDSRLRELERNILAKLRRTVPHLSVEYADTGRAGVLGVPTSDKYGLIVYEYAGRRDESRSTSEREVLPIIHELAGQDVQADPVADYRGFPLVTSAQATAIWFYALLPAMGAFGWWLTQRPPRDDIRRVARRGHEEHV